MRIRLKPNAAHPLTVQPTGHRIVVRVGDQVIADTQKALTLRESSYPAVQYIPLADVDTTVLAKTDSSTYCPFKGDASYYSLVTPSGELTDAAWAYEHPHPAVAEIANHLAFYPKLVEISVAQEPVAPSRR
jgi:uncharacterized protein (DUF427 family)